MGFHDSVWGGKDERDEMREIIAVLKGTLFVISQLRDDPSATVADIAELARETLEATDD